MSIDDSWWSSDRSVLDRCANDAQHSRLRSCGGVPFRVRLERDLVERVRCDLVASVEGLVPVLSSDARSIECDLSSSSGCADLCGGGDLRICVHAMVSVLEMIDQNSSRKHPAR
jgi:hypothetical protein